MVDLEAMPIAMLRFRPVGATLRSLDGLHPFDLLATRGSLFRELFGMVIGSEVGIE